MNHILSINKFYIIFFADPFVTYNDIGIEKYRAEKKKLVFKFFNTVRILILLRNQTNKMKKYTLFQK